VNPNVKKVLETILEGAEAVKVLLEEFEKTQAPEGGADQGGSAGGETAVSGPTPAPEGQEEAGAQEGREFVHCTLKFFKGRLLLEAARTAIDINPMNAPMLQGPMAALGGGGIATPEHIALLTSKYWQPQARQLTVSFMETTAADLRARILLHMNAWSARCGISFAWTQGAGDVRISRGQGGYWSYLGTDILHIPRNRQTMNLQSFTMATPESEYRRVVRHETGHCLTGDTLIDCPRDLEKYPRGIPIKDLVGQRPWVYAWHDGGMVIRRASRVWLSRRQAPLVRVRLRGGQGYHGRTFLPPMELVGTPEHRVLLADGKTWKELGKLKAGDRLCSLYRSKNGPRSRIRWTGLADRVREHTFVCEQVYGPRPDGHDAHHKNTRMMDQSPDNLEWKDEYLHCRDHAVGRVDSPETSARRSAGQRDREPPTVETRAKMAASARTKPPISEETREKISAASRGKTPSLETRNKRREAMARFYAGGGKPPGLGKHPSSEARAKRSASMRATLARKKAKAVANHVVVCVERLSETQDVYDMTVPGADSFVANGVVVHNSLGYPHEHMRKDLVARIDPQKAIRWFAQTQGWDQQTVQQQVLTPLDESSLMATPADEDSIMCYQLPASITNDGRPIRGGNDINESDYAFAAKIYPKPGGQGGDDLDWMV
jgi:hypothetical protein